MEKGVFKEKTDWPGAGNRNVTDFLEKSLSADRLSHTYIFLGQKDIGKTAAAVHFAKSLLCQGRKDGQFSHPCETCSSCHQTKGLSEGFASVHGDFHLLKRAEGKRNIAIEDVRDFIHSLSLSSFLNSYKVGIIKDADDLSLDAANALLKTLEEPQAKVVVILTASRLDSLPVTIISRSQVLRFQPVESSLIHDHLVQNLGVGRSEAKIAARLSLGRPALAARFVEEKDFAEGYKEKAAAFIDFFRLGLSDRLSAVSSLLDKEGDEDKAERALRIISIWLGTARDALLLSSNNGDIVQHEDRRDDLAKAARAIGPSGVLRVFGLLKAGEKQIRANVNPKLVLENIAINVK
jgi:DNA polymerase III subunit delta'